VYSVEKERQAGRRHDNSEHASTYTGGGARRRRFFEWNRGLAHDFEVFCAASALRAARHGRASFGA
jgi:hypothetical protein